jgi:hypothetical protein
VIAGFLDGDEGDASQAQVLEPDHELVVAWDRRYDFFKFRPKNVQKFAI